MTKKPASGECLRLAGQLLRAFEGGAWHGPSIQELLFGLAGEQAAAHPVARAHSIWELILHIEFWEQAAWEAIQGTPMPEQPVSAERDWPKPHTWASAWQEDVERLFAVNQRLHHAMKDFEDRRLDDIVPGREYNFYFLFNGITQHTLYHAGQIALLKRALKVA